MNVWAREKNCVLKEIFFLSKTIIILGPYKYETEMKGNLENFF